MIEPAFATMLCFVQTDAALERQTAELLLGVCVKRSFDRISVDGQLSTNDTVILQCSGASGVRVAPESEDELRLGEALDALLRMLAVMIVRDVRDTNMCALHVRADPRTGKVLVFAAIDNLWKGSASQAVQNLNLMFGLPETLGIEP